MNKRTLQNPRQLEISSAADQAAEWLRILHDPHLSGSERERFLNWSRESPLHVKELLMAYATWRKLERADALRQIDLEELTARITPNVRPIGPHAALAVGGRRQRSRRTVFFAEAAAVVAAVAIAVYWLAFAGTYSTSAGEQLRVSLKDGSGIYLNSQSRVRVSFSAQVREVYLDQGQALFEVERDPERTFRVHAAGTVIQALGTQFDVRLLPDKVSVAVVEGSVQVSSLPQTPQTERAQPDLARLSAGEATTIGRSGRIARPVPIDVDTAMSWWQQQLVFERTPLSQVAAEFNRYNRLQLRIEGEAIARKRFNGVFGSRKPESFLGYLAQDESLEFERHEYEVVIRARPGARPAGTRE